MHNRDILLTNQHHCAETGELTGFVRILESHGILISYFPGPGKFWNHCMVMESPGKGPGICWAVLEKIKSNEFPVSMNCKLNYVLLVI